MVRENLVGCSEGSVIFGGALGWELCDCGVRFPYLVSGMCRFGPGEGVSNWFSSFYFLELSFTRPRTSRVSGVFRHSW